MMNYIVQDLKKPLHWAFKILFAVSMLYFLAVKVLPALGTTPDQELTGYKPLFATNLVQKNDLTCLARNIYFEAGNEPELGKIAVGVVTLNRTHDHRWGMSICDVVEQKTRVPMPDNQKVQTVCQFSWTCGGSKQIVYQGAWDESMKVAKMLMQGGYERYAPMFQGAVFYHATYVNPGWNYKKVAVINDHIFYK
jgi:spore germination cell wall hydrolase CwlJ-like protein